MVTGAASRNLHESLGRVNWRPASVRARALHPERWQEGPCELFSGQHATVAELADAQDSGSPEETTPKWHERRLFDSLGWPSDGEAAFPAPNTRVAPPTLAPGHPSCW